MGDGLRGTGNNPFATPFRVPQFNTSPQEVQDFHNNSDVDRDPSAQHHTLGLGPNQAATGDHNHDVRHGRYDLEHAHDVEDLLITGDASWVHQSRLSRNGRNIDLTIVVSTNVFQPATAVSVQVPAIHRPMGAGNKYFWCTLLNSGNQCAVYFAPDGTIRTVLASVAATDGYLGFISYLAKYQ